MRRLPQRRPQRPAPIIALRSRFRAAEFEAASRPNPPMGQLQALGTAPQFIFPYRNNKIALCETSNDAPASRDVSILRGRQMVKKAVVQTSESRCCTGKKRKRPFDGLGSAPKEATPTLESEIGAEVRRLRKSFDLTVSELGVASGISTGMLSKIENGSISPSLSTLSALAKALNGSDRRTVSRDRRATRLFLRQGRNGSEDRTASAPRPGICTIMLGHSLGGEVTVEPYLITLKADAEPYIDFRHDRRRVHLHADRQGAISPRRPQLRFGARRFPVLRCSWTPWPRRIDQVTHDISIHHHLSATKLTVLSGKLGEGHASIEGGVRYRALRPFPTA